MGNPQFLTPLKFLRVIGLLNLVSGVESERTHKMLDVTVRIIYYILSSADLGNLKEQYLNQIFPLGAIHGGCAEGV